MKGFIKFTSIVLFGAGCFFAGAAKESGHKTAAIYFIIAGVGILINGFASVIEMETQELMEKNRKKTDELLRETVKIEKKLERKLKP